MKRMRYPHKTRGCDRITCISNGGTSGCRKGFQWWPAATGASKTLEAYEAQLLLAAGDVSRVRAAPMWRRVNAGK
jgi:hypothetical protein